MLRIFVSYRAKDSLPLTRQIVARLKQEFCNVDDDIVFFDKHGILPGDDWKQDLENGLQNADILLMVVGPNWLKSRSYPQKDWVFKENWFFKEDWVFKEVLTAVSRGIPIVPVLFGDSYTPSGKVRLPNLAEGDKLPYYIKKIQDLQYFAFRTAMQIKVTDDGTEALTIIKPTLTNTPEAPPIPTLEQELARLVQAVKRVPVYDLLRRDTAIIRDILQEIRTDETQLKAIDELIHELQHQKRASESKHKAANKEDTHQLFEHDTAYVDILVDAALAIRVAQRHIRERSEHDHIIKRMDASIERIAKQIAEIDQTLSNYGYEKLKKIFTNESDNEKRNAARRVMGYYREYHNPKRTAKDNDQPKQNQLTVAQNIELWATMWRLTWREFVSAEVVGALMMSLLLALMLSVHTIMVNDYITLRPYIPFQAETYSNCWEQECLVGSGLNIGLFLCVAYFSWIVVRFYGERKETSGGWFQTSIVIGLLVLILLIGSFAGVFKATHLLTFLSYGFVTLPAGLIFLAGTGLSSVLSLERKTRSEPILSWVSIIAGMLSLGIGLMSLFAVVEKSRPYWLYGLLLGVLWGIFLGIGTWLGRQRTRLGVKRHTPRDIYSLSEGLWRFGILAVMSLLFVFVISAIDYTFFNNNQFFPIPILSPEDTSQLSALGSNMLAAQQAVEFFNLAFLGLWMSLVYFVGVEALNHKMRNPAANTKVNETKTD